MDIRTYFKHGQGGAEAGGGAGVSNELKSKSDSPPPAPSTKKKPIRKRRIVVSDDDDDDYEPITKRKSSKSSTSSSPKSSRSSSLNVDEKIKGSSPSQKKKVKVEEEEFVPSAYFTKRSSGRLDKQDSMMSVDMGEEEAMDVDENVEAEKTTPQKTLRKKLAKDDEYEFEGSEDDAYEQELPRRKNARATIAAKKKSSRKRGTDDLDDDAGASARKSGTAKKQTGRGKAAIAKDDNEDTGQSHQRTDSQKAAFRTYLQRSGPSAPGSKDIPVGAANCLAGLTFVFTGELESLAREDAQDLVKRYGGRVTGAPSSKTSFVVVGADAGEKKLEKVRKLGIKQINEDELFDLVRTSKPQSTDAGAAVSSSKKKSKEPDIAESAKQAQDDGFPQEEQLAELWVDKYKPKELSALCGNKAGVEKIRSWLQNWSSTGQFQAALISGPPGIGKTTAAHIVGKVEGYDIMELNASDTRSKKVLADAIKDVLDNMPIAQFFQAKQEKQKAAKSKGKEKSTATVPQLGKLLIIMDEVDGMSAGDRGGVSELIQLIKLTRVPIVCICNDRTSPKMRSLVNYCLDVRFQRPRAEQVRSRIMSIAFKEKLQISKEAVDELIKGAGSDIRQVLNMLSMYRLGQSSMSYDEGKALSKASEKDIVLSPWDITARLFSPATWNPRNNTTMSDKIELYFHDYSIVPLMIQENYLKVQPQRSNEFAQMIKGTSLSSEEKARVTTLECLEKAADSISDADLVGSMIHGTQQHWSLMPTHAVLSTVRPTGFAYGSSSGSSYGGGPYSFPSWLGMNSKAAKAQRQLKAIQAHMRMRISGDKNEVRQNYLSALIPAFSKPLIEEGTNGIAEVIQRLDKYYLTREDWEVILEFGLGECRLENTLKKIDTKTKTAFTRTYNSTAHPTAFLETIANVSKVKGGASRDVPDMEEVVEDDDDVQDEEGTPESDTESDIAHDKYIKKKGNAAGKSSRGRGGSSRGRGRGSSRGRGKRS